ncbi:unnamed protein product [Rotaria socialis]|uniref:Protein kinase domain-containing protein n=1 Tax=Rotaria socialis TaxID=392032 RepID=A0A820J2N6_9BILA|nr:unnamed protein product [Rotaria socialis]CAF3334841.1 unnamed protein product [Rotaria socialis]CAF3445958.1 unnamed protein product [Rotaria socialis]CAF4320407.1 unnamed protein product [Rotaria socialis]CAF4473386.1 unnamed protein product [Rotaria socialis]
MINERMMHRKSLIGGLLRGVRLLTNLKHQHIIQLFGICSSLSTKKRYPDMEFVRDVALNSLLQKGKSGLYPNVFIQYAENISDGMKYLHDEASEHVIHRHLKCSNIVLVLILQPIEDIHHDNGLLYKTFNIIDFRLAKHQACQLMEHFLR